MNLSMRQVLPTAWSPNKINLYFFFVRTVNSEILMQFVSKGYKNIMEMTSKSIIIGPVYNNINSNLHPMLSSSRTHDPTLYNQIIDSLSKTILQLQSDQVLQQMRNDQELYQFKMGHIVEILQKQLSYMEDFQILMQENQAFKKEVILIQAEAKNQKLMFTESIDNIEANAKKILKEKDTEITKLHHKLKEKQAEIQNLETSLEQTNKKYIHVSNASKQMEEELSTVREQIKHQKKQMSEYQKSIQSQQMSITTSSHSHQKFLKELKLQHAQQIEEYEKAIKKMQGDMLVIKNQWQKKCQEIEKNLRIFYEQKIFDMEEKKTREMLEHIDAVKEGKDTIVIKTDENMINSKLSLIRQQHEGQINKLKEEIEELEGVYKNVEQELSVRVMECEKSSKKIVELERKIEEKEQQINNLVQKSAKEAQKVKLIIKEHQKLENAHLQQASSFQKQIKGLKNKLQELEQLNSTLQKSLRSAKASLEQESQKNSKLYDELQKKQVNLQNVMKNNEKINKNYESQKNNHHETAQQLEQFSKKYMQSEKQLTSLRKNHEKMKQCLKNNLDLLKSQVVAMKKNLQLVKEEIKYNITYLRDGMSKRMRQTIDYVKQSIQSHQQSKGKQKIEQLLDEVEKHRERGSIQYEELSKEKDNLKREVSDLENCLLEKNKQIQQLMLNNSQTGQNFETYKAQARDQIIIQKQRSYKLEQKLQLSQRQYHTALEQTKMQVKESIKKLSYKWTDEISRMEEEIKKKDHQLYVLTEHTNKLLKQYEETNEQEQMAKEDCRKYRKKYEQFKNKSEEQIEDLLQRLEKQSKQKLELDKELRAVKSQLNNYSNSNNYGLQKRQKHTESTPNIKIEMPVSSRQQEFSQLKNLIAKTYEISYSQKDRPERDFRKRNYN